jgi:hypothetical protein
MTDQPTTKDDAARRAARALISRGLARPNEAAELAGISRELLQHWIKDIDWRKARGAALALAWQRAIKRRRR